ncbi:hypothetical protein GCM10027161_05490 [Microbispora hainanensis]
MHAPKSSLMVLAGLLLVSCTTAASQLSGPLRSLDRQQACIEAPNPSDVKAVQCYPLEDGLEIKQDMYRIGTMVTLRVREGRILSIEEIGAPVG